MLKQRIITALILIPIVLLLLFFLPPIPFAVLTAILLLAGAWEWTNLMGLKTRKQRLVYLFFIAAAMALSRNVSMDILLPLSFLWWVFAAGLVLFYPKHTSDLVKPQWVRAIMGLLVLVPCWFTLNDIRLQQDGTVALLFLLVIIWGADSAAYFAGKQFGKHKLMPKVSPGKTVEGLAAALVSTVFLTLLALWICNTPYLIWPWAILIALVTILFSIVGDLFESMIKRVANVKDSGQLLPGHGGLLDRIDSLTAAAPVFAFGAWFVGHYLS